MDADEGAVWVWVDGERVAEPLAEGLRGRDLFFAVDLCRGDKIRIVASEDW